MSQKIPLNLNVIVNVNVNEFVFYSHGLAGTSKKIFFFKKLLPDCNTESTEQEEDLFFKE